MPVLPSAVVRVAFGPLLLLLAAGSASAQFLHTFTSGPVPLGDGIDYPPALNPARQRPGGGVSPDLFDTEVGTIFQNTNGNPAFFDANNLLTRPAQRITNEAFWTDPRIGVFDNGEGFFFESASFGFQFSPRAGEDFGFDLAVASVSDAVPTSVPFFIQNTNGESGTFALGLTAGSGDIIPLEADTFDTLNSPFPGREARFRIPHAQIEALLGSSAPLLIFSIDLFDISTLGGTTQVALDNFVLAGASVLPDEPQREPVRFQSELIPPGELLWFILDPATSGETGILVDAGGLPPTAVIELVTRAATPPGSALPEQTSTLSIPVDSALRGEPSVGLIAPRDDAPPGLSPSVTPLGGLEVNGEAPFAEGASYFLQAAMLLKDGDSLSSADLQALSEIEKQKVEINRINEVSRVKLVDLPGGKPLWAAGILAADAVPKTLGPPDVFMLYLNYTLEEYLDELASLGQDPVVGDTGGVYEPVGSGPGQPFDFRVETWTIADQPGGFAPVLFVPEPAAAWVGAAAGLALSAFARRRTR